VNEQKNKLLQNFEMSTISGGSGTVSLGHVQKMTAEAKAETQLQHFVPAAIAPELNPPLLTSSTWDVQSLPPNPGKQWHFPCNFGYATQITSLVHGNETVDLKFVPCPIVSNFS